MVLLTKPALVLRVRKGRPDGRPFRRATNNQAQAQLNPCLPIGIDRIRLPVAA